MPSILVKISRSMEGKLFLNSTHGFVCKAQQKVRKYCFYEKNIYILLVTKIDKYKKKKTKPTHAKAERTRQHVQDFLVPFTTRQNRKASSTPTVVLKINIILGQ